MIRYAYRFIFVVIFYLLAIFGCWVAMEGDGLATMQAMAAVVIMLCLARKQVDE